MAIDSKDDNHQPKGTPNAGGSAPKAGAGDDDDLHEPRHPVGAAGTAWGGRFAPKALKHSFDRLAVEYRKALAPVGK